MPQKDTLYGDLFVVGNLGIGATTTPAKLNVTGSITASAALARGVYFNNTLVAAANSDVLVGLDINPTFTNGAFTGVSNYALRVKGSTQYIFTTGDGLIFNRDGAGNYIQPITQPLVLYSPNSSVYQYINNSGVGINTPPSARLHIKGSGTTTSTTSLRVENSSGTVGLIVNDAGNTLLGTTTDSGQKLQISGSMFIKGTTSLTATKIFEVQNGSGTSIMDFRDNQYAFFGCGQGGGSASGFIFNYSNTSYTQFSGYNYGAGAGSYKPILMDTDGGGRNQGIFVNFGVSTNTPPNSDTEFAVRGRTSNSSTYISKFVDSSNVERFSIRADGALFTDGNIGYTGTVNFPMNPPGQQNIDIVNGMIVNVF